MHSVKKYSAPENTLFKNITCIVLYFVANRFDTLLFQNFTHCETVCLSVIIWKFLLIYRSVMTVSIWICFFYNSKFF